MVVAAGRVLLTQRADLAVWCLPGGAVDPGGSLAQAAVREVQEETGVAIALTRLIGVGSRPRWRAGGGHEIVFAARPIGGALHAQPEEVLALDYVDPVALPATLVP
jgi:8-oxo-dGTP pyrophosphatase MutT (NUDIX family)